MSEEKVLLKDEIWDEGLSRLANALYDVVVTKGQWWGRYLENRKRIQEHGDYLMCSDIPVELSEVQFRETVKSEIKRLIQDSVFEIGGVETISRLEKRLSEQIEKYELEFKRIETRALLDKIQILEAEKSLLEDKLSKIEEALGIQYD